MIYWENILARIKTFLIYKRSFCSFSGDSMIVKPMKLDNTKSISIGGGTYIAHHCWLMGNFASDYPTLKIGDNVQIGHFAHIVGLNNVIIEDSVLLADKVYISDCGHAYENVTCPILNQPTRNLGSVTIGSGSWLGENVCVIGANVGKNSVIGANSVVTKDIPDYCVAVGAPAKVIKKYNFQSKKWEKV